MTKWTTALVLTTFAIAGCASVEMPDPDAPPPPSSYELEEEIVTTS